MSVLGNKLKIVLADTFAMHLKAWNYHWNVEGSDFYEYHKFLEMVYTDLQSAVDPIAEHIRALDEYAPGSLSRYKELTNIEDELVVVSGQESISRLQTDNNKILESITDAYYEAERAKELGLCNFLQDRIDDHKKLGWMLKATLAKP
jgi:starvation-inducible DNA-binding protein